MTIMAYAAGDLKATLEALAIEAHEDGWDGLGSKRAEERAYFYARRFLNLLASDIIAPEISVDNDGEFFFEWDQGRRRVFSVSIGPDGMLSYAGLFDQEKIHGREPLQYSLPEIIHAWLARFSTHASF